MHKNSNYLKVALSIIFIFFSTTVLLINYYRPTDLARNTFFYADFFVANEIISSGKIGSATAAPNQWGKINAIRELPLQPMLLAILNLVSGLPFNIIYNLFPSMLLISASFIILLRRLGVSLIPGIIISIAAGIITPATAFYPISLFSVVKGILFMGAAVVAIHINQGRSTRDSDTLIILTIFLFFLFYWDPEKYLLLSGIIGCTLILYSVRFKKVDYTLSLFTIMAFIGYQVFQIPLSPYIINLKSVLVTLITLDFSNPATSYATSSGASRGYYSLLPLILLLPLSFLGGLYSLHDFKNRINSVYALVVGWGVAAAVVSIIYMVGTTSWLAGRSYFFALPVIILGFSRIMKEISPYKQYILSGLFLSLVLISIALQLGTTPVAIHTYEPGIESGTDWADTYVPSKIITDHKLGAPLATNEGIISRYPESYNKTESIFYPDNYSEFSRSTDKPIILSEGMSEYGIRVQYSQGKIPKDTLDTMVTNSNSYYSNGHLWLVKGE